MFNSIKYHSEGVPTMRRRVQVEKLKIIFMIGQKKNWIFEYQFILHFFVEYRNIFCIFW